MKPKEIISEFHAAIDINGDNIWYIDHDGGWTDNFVFAELWSSEETATRKAIELGGHVTGRKYVVGRVNVACDPFYEMQVVK